MVIKTITDIISKDKVQTRWPGKTPEGGYRT